MSIQFIDLVKQFGKETILNQFSLEIKEKDRVALIGSNGAGKTTLIRCLLGEYIYSGQVLVDGVAPRQDRMNVLKNISFVPQLPPPLRMPVRDLIKFSAKICTIDADAIIQCGEKLGLDFSVINKRPFVKLSGGQKQKILIAIAMARPVKTMIFDEPTANLDPKARAVFFDMMSERLDRTMIISSHRLEEVASLVNRVVEMDQGRLVLDDRVDAADPGTRMRCTVILTKQAQTFGATAKDWNLTSNDDMLTWHGEITAADRLRFLGVLARYSGLLQTVKLEQIDKKTETTSGDMESAK